MLNDDYNMDEEFSMESMPSLKTYNIPKKNKTKEILTTIPLDSREAINLKKEMVESMWDSAPYAIDVIKMQLVNNSKLEKRFATKRNEMKEQSRSDVSDSFAYIRFDHIRQKKVENEILENGLSTKLQSHYLPPSRQCCIGNDKYGIYLSRCADVLSRFLTLDRVAVKECTLLVCKYMKGKLKAVANQSNQMEPTPDFDGHCSQLFQHGKKFSQEKIFDCSQIYLYEIDLDKMTNDCDSIFEERPRQCIPYATITFRVVRNTPIAPQPQLSMVPQVNGNSTINNLSQQDDTMPLFVYRMYLHQLKFVWQGFYHTPKRCAGEFALALFSHQPEHIPLAGMNILYVTQRLSWDKLAAVLPSKIFRKPPCLSLKPMEERQGFRFMHAEMQPLPSAPSNFIQNLHNSFIKTKSAGICTLNSGLKIIILPSCVFTDKLGITVPGYPPIIHFVFMKHIFKDTSLPNGAAFEKFVKHHKLFMNPRLLQLEEIKRTNKVSEQLIKHKCAFTKDQCDFLRNSLKIMYFKQHPNKSKDTQENNNNSSSDVKSENSSNKTSDNNNTESELKKEEEPSETIEDIILLSSDEDELVIVEENTTTTTDTTTSKNVTKKKVNYNPSNNYCCEDPQCLHGKVPDKVLNTVVDNSTNMVSVNMEIDDDNELDKENTNDDLSIDEQPVNTATLVNTPVNKNPQIELHLESESLPKQHDDNIHKSPTSTSSSNNTNNPAIINISNQASDKQTSAPNLTISEKHSTTSIDDTTSMEKKKSSHQSNGQIFGVLFEEMKKLKSCQSYHEIDKQIAFESGNEKEKIVKNIKSMRENLKRTNSEHSSKMYHPPKRTRWDNKTRSRSPRHHSRSRSPHSVTRSRSPHSVTGSRSPYHRSRSRSPYRGSPSRGSSRSRQSSTANQTKPTVDRLAQMEKKANLLVKLARNQSSAHQLTEKVKALKMQEKKKTITKTKNQNAPNKVSEMTYPINTTSATNATSSKTTTTLEEITTFQSGCMNIGCDEDALSVLPDRERMLKDAEARCHSSSSDDSGPDTWMERASARLSQPDADPLRKTNNKAVTDENEGEENPVEERIIFVPDVRLNGGTSPLKETTNVDITPTVTNPDRIIKPQVFVPDVRLNGGASPLKETTNIDITPPVTDPDKISKPKELDVSSKELSESKNREQQSSNMLTPPRYRSLQSWADSIRINEIDSFEQKILAELRSE